MPRFKMLDYYRVTTFKMEKSWDGTREVKLIDDNFMGTKKEMEAKHKELLASGQSPDMVELVHVREHDCD